MDIALGCEEILFLSTEDKGSPTITALERLVYKTHWVTSFLSICGQSKVTQHLHESRAFNQVCDNLHQANKIL